MAKHFKTVHFYLQCDKCFFVGLSTVAMKKHESDKHSLPATPERPVSKLCYQYGRKQKIENQEFIIKEIDDCPKATSSKYSRKSEDPLALAEEIKITNEDRDKELESLGETPFACQKCNRSFATEKGLKQHEMKGN